MLNKHNKYADLPSSIDFVPVAIETLPPVFDGRGRVELDQRTRPSSIGCKSWSKVDPIPPTTDLGCNTERQCCLHSSNCSARVIFWVRVEVEWRLQIKFTLYNNNNSETCEKLKLSTVKYISMYVSYFKILHIGNVQIDTKIKSVSCMPSVLRRFNTQWICLTLT